MHKNQRFDLGPDVQTPVWDLFNQMKMNTALLLNTFFFFRFSVVLHKRYLKLLWSNLAVSKPFDTLVTTKGLSLKARTFTFVDT